MRNRYRRLWSLTWILALLLVAACGGESEETTTTTAAAPESALKVAVA